MAMSSWRVIRILTDTYGRIHTDAARICDTTLRGDPYRIRGHQLIGRKLPHRHIDRNRAIAAMHGKMELVTGHERREQRTQ